MKNALNRFYTFLDQPIYLWSRILIALAAIPLIFALFQPLWKIEMWAPQYPKGLTIDIYTHTVESGNEGRDLPEVNVLNHYIGMKTIDRADLTDLDWIPFALAALALLALRTAAIGNVRMLLDLAVITAFVGAFSMFRFVYKLYTYGHNLDPTAPFKVEPFTPALLGTKQIANFTTRSTPALGTYLIIVSATIISLVAGWHLLKGYLDSRRAQRQAA